MLNEHWKEPHAEVMRRRRGSGLRHLLLTYEVNSARLTRIVVYGARCSPLGRVGEIARHSRGRRSSVLMRLTLIPVLPSII